VAEPDDAAEKAESVDTGALVDTESAARKLDAEEVEDIDGQDAAADDAKDVAGQDTENRTRQWFSGIRGLIAASVAAIVALLGVGGWLGYRLDEDHRVQSQRNLYVQVARQTAINLTTIDYSEVDADIKRVLDSATGGFHDEFQDRSQPFAEVVKKVQSKTEGTIAESALLSYTKDQAQVLVAVAVKTSMAGALADQEPRRWRIRLTVDKAGDGAKVSNVEFVP
jgi:Mce-associated membrane protein